MPDAFWAGRCVHWVGSQESKVLTQQEDTPWPATTPFSRLERVFVAGAAEPPCTQELVARGHALTLKPRPVSCLHF